MRASLIALLSGVLFALGVGISGMTQPGKVTAFLDFTGDWDPSLLFVMAGAIAIYSVGYRCARNKPRPLFAESFHLPTLRTIDRRLVLGSAIFGIGWGLGGFCPGPALTSIVSLKFEPVIFVSSMLSGMALFEGVDRWRKKS